MGWIFRRTKEWIRLLRWGLRGRSCKLVDSLFREPNDMVVMRWDEFDGTWRP